MIVLRANSVYYSRATRIQIYIQYYSSVFSRKSDMSLVVALEMINKSKECCVFCVFFTALTGIQI